MSLPVPSDPCDAYEDQPTYYRTRLVKGGPYVACMLQRIIERDETGDILGIDYIATVDGMRTDPLNPRGWPWRRIEESEFNYLSKNAEWCRKYSPNEPAANPTRPANESEVRIV